MLNKTIDQTRSTQLVEHPFVPGAAALVTVDRQGAGRWVAITREDAMRLARELEAFALGE